MRSSSEFGFSWCYILHFRSALYEVVGKLKIQDIAEITPRLDMLVWITCRRSLPAEIPKRLESFHLISGLWPNIISSNYCMLRTPAADPKKHNAKHPNKNGCNLLHTVGRWKKRQVAAHLHIKPIQLWTVTRLEEYCRFISQLGDVYFPKLKGVKYCTQKAINQMTKPKFVVVVCSVRVEIYFTVLRLALRCLKIQWDDLLSLVFYFESLRVRSWWINFRFTLFVFYSRELRYWCLLWKIVAGTLDWIACLELYHTPDKILCISAPIQNVIIKNSVFLVQYFIREYFN